MERIDSTVKDTEIWFADVLRRQQILIGQMTFRIHVHIAASPEFHFRFRFRNSEGN